MRHRRREPARRPADPNCPSWCAVDHAIDLDLEDGIRLHERTLIADVLLVAADDIEAGTRTTTEIVVRAASGDSVTWATGMALAILEASDHLGAGAR